MASTKASVAPPATLPAALQTYLLTWIFCLPFCGTPELFSVAFIGQLLFIAAVLFTYRHSSLHILSPLKQHKPWLFWLLVAWISATFISFVIIFITPTNGWQRLAAISRQTFIVTQIAFCFALIKFYAASCFLYITLLRNFALGVIGIITLHALMLYFGPSFPSEMWLKDPYLSPNTRDLGDLTTAAIAIFSVLFWLETNKLKSFGYGVLFTLVCAYLLWTGGRTAIASSFLISLIVLAISAYYANIGIKKIITTALVFISAYAICTHLSIYDWNGLVRYAPDWRPDYNPQADISSGRVAMWIWCIDVIKQAPWFGHGTFSFYFLPERFVHEFWHDHPHNLFLQALVEWGAIGTILMAALLTAIGYHALLALKLQTQSKNATYLSCLGIVLVIILGSLTGGSLWDYQPVMIAVVAFAGLLIKPK